MNGTIITGKSPDGSDAQVAEGVYDYGNDQWGTLPQDHSTHRMKRSPIERTYNEVMDYAEKHGRTIHEEYELIQQKKSNLSKRLRDFVELLIEIEKHSPNGENTPPIPHE